MKKWLAGLLAAVSLAASGYETQFITDKERVKDIAALEIEAWMLACTYTAYDCLFTPRPLIWYEQMERGQHGYYRFKPRSPAIVINSEYYGRTVSGIVMVHEMIHYLQHRSPDAEKRPYCQREAEAFTTTELIMRDLGYKNDLVYRWVEARGWYWC